MKRIKNFKLMLIGIVVLLVLALSYSGVMNRTMLGRSSDLTQGKVSCTTDTDCPKPQCFGSFNIAQKSDVESNPTSATEAEKQAAGLDNWWYDAQGNLQDVKCVNQKCQTSPFCFIEYKDITGWIGNHPFEWLKQYPWVIFALIGIVALIIFATAGRKS